MPKKIRPSTSQTEGVIAAKSSTHASKLLSILEKIDQEHIAEPDMFTSERGYVSLTLFGLLSTVVGENMLIIGEPGTGKTTVSKLFASSIYNIPSSVVSASMIRGTPEVTLASMIGYLNPGDFVKGKESVVWRLFPFSPLKIIDEFNRIPPQKQNILFQGIDKDDAIWEVYSNILIGITSSIFATINYSDEGTSPMSGPILDRFGVMVEASPPPAIHIPDIKIRNPDKKNVDLKQVSYWRKQMNDAVELGDVVSALEILLSADKGGERIKLSEMREIREKVYEIANQIPEFAYSSAAGKERTEESLKAYLFLSYLTAEANYSPFGVKRSTDPLTSTKDHFKGLQFSDVIKFNLTPRSANSIRLYAAALAFIEGREYVTLKDIVAVAPYCIAHKLVFVDRNKYLNDAQRSDEYRIFAAKTKINGVLKRFTETYHLILKYDETLKSLDPKYFTKNDWKDNMGFDHPMAQKLFDSYKREKLGNRRS